MSIVDFRLLIPIDTLHIQVSVLLILVLLHEALTTIYLHWSEHDNEVSAFHENELSFVLICYLVCRDVSATSYLFVHCIVWMLYIFDITTTSAFRDVLSYVIGLGLYPDQSPEIWFDYHYFEYTLVLQIKVVHDRLPFSSKPQLFQDCGYILGDVGRWVAGCTECVKISGNCVV